jgi:hypothetical protein
MNTEKILDVAIRTGREAFAEKKLQYFRPLTRDELSKHINTLSKAKDHIWDMQEEMTRLRNEIASLRSQSTTPTAPTPFHGNNAAKTAPTGQGWEQRYRERVAEAEKEVEKAMSGVLSASGPMEQNLAMQTLKLAEQKLNFQKRNFK